MRFKSVEHAIKILKNENRTPKKRGPKPKKKEPVISITSHEALHYADCLPLEWGQIR